MVPVVPLERDAPVVHEGDVPVVHGMALGLAYYVEGEVPAYCGEELVLAGVVVEVGLAV